MANFSGRTAVLQINKHFECFADIEDIGRVTEVIFRHRESFDKYNRCHGKNKPPKFFGSPFLAVQDSSIGDLVTHSVSESVMF